MRTSKALGVGRMTLFGCPTLQRFPTLLFSWPLGVRSPQLHTSFPALVYHPHMLLPLPSFRGWSRSSRKYERGMLGIAYSYLTCPPKGYWRPCCGLKTSFSKTWRCYNYYTGVSLSSPTMFFRNPSGAPSQKRFERWMRLLLTR